MRREELYLADLVDNARGPFAGTSTASLACDGMPTGRAVRARLARLVIPWRLVCSACPGPMATGWADFHLSHP